VWHWDSGPFGTEAPDEDPDGDGTKVTLNLRLPGQYYDSETGLHYNGHRDYDPATGRYGEPDPIGLAGGLNVYGYVGSDPVNRIDRDGREAALPLPGIGTLAGEIAGAAGALGSNIGLGIGALIYPKPVGEGSDIVPPMEANFPPGYWPGDKGAAEWGRRDGCGAKEGKRRFHKGIKQGDNMSKAMDKYGVNPSTGDVIDPEGEVIGNLGDE
jgi:RHS repeat-associated protein